MACNVRAHLILGAFTWVIWFSPRISASGIRVDLIHRGSPDVGTAVERSRSRQRQIQNLISQRKDAQTPIHAAGGDYYAKLAVGTPPVSFDALVETASDLIWTPSLACKSGCLEPPLFFFFPSAAQPAVFSPSNSSTYSKVPCENSLCEGLGDLKWCTPDCEYAYGYGEAPPAKGILSFDTLAIGSGYRLPHVAFGAGYASTGQGVLGLGRGPLSLISQLGSRADNKFSYCLAGAAGKSSPLIFGESASLGAGGPAIPYVLNNYTNGTLYYLPLEGISVGGSLVDVPDGTFDVKADGEGGVIIDSGTTLTILDDAAYGPVKRAFQSLIKLSPEPPGLPNPGLCYDVPQDGNMPAPPSLVFHFQGGVDWAFPADNYFVPDAGYNYYCLAILGASDSGDSGGGPSIIGNLLQQNFHILYDNGNNSLSFRQFPCNIL